MVMKKLLFVISFLFSDIYRNPEYFTKMHPKGFRFHKKQNLRMI